MDKNTYLGGFMSKKLVAILLLCVCCFCGCGKSVEELAPEIAITSSSLVNGAWDVQITKVDGGENLSPQLAWDAVEDASCYAVYMLDLNAANWMHMKYLTEKTSLTFGEVPDYLMTEDYTGYKGPYPPSGSHEYVVYVVALKEADVDLPGKMDMNGTDDIKDMMSILDVTKEGKSGNVIAYGELSGTYTRK